MLPTQPSQPSPSSQSAPGTAGAAASGVSRPSRVRQVELILSRITALPTLSAVATRLLRIAADDQAQIEEVSRLLEADPALSSRLLSMCRRSDKGLGKNITTVRRAVVMLGLDAVRAAVLSLQVIDALSGAPAVALADDGPAAGGAAGGEPFDRKGFWLHSVSVASAAELIAREHPSYGVAPDEAFTAGLLHDLGKLVLALILPRAYASLARQAVVSSADIASLERSVLGVDHHIVGKRLAEHWTLPHALQDTMWLHGQSPAAVPEFAHARLIRLVTVADALARRLQMGFSGNLAPGRPLEELAAQAGLDIGKITGGAAGGISGPGVIDRLHENVRRRCEDLGLDQPDTEAGILDSLAKASQRLARLEQIAAEESRSARESAAVLHALRTFQKSALAGAHLTQVLERVAESAGAFLYEAPTCVVVHEHSTLPGQSDGARVWTLVRARPVGAEAITALSPPPGMPSLAALLREPTPGALAELLAFVREGLEPAPPIRSLRILALAGEFGPASVVIHDRPASSQESAHLDVLAAAWTGAIVAASQHDAARALAEQVADTNRALTEAQEKLTQAQALERLAHVTAGAAHEMNSPLAVISGRAQLIASKSKDPATVTDAKTIVQAAHTLDSLITRLHALAKPGAAQIELVSLQDLAREAVALARQKLAPGEATDPPVPVRVHIQQATTAARTDRKLLARALAELVLNALQSGSRSPVELRIHADAATDRLALDVCDTGRGMTDHELAHAFDPFFSSLPAGRRAGLGLATARRLAAVLGAEVLLDSTPGQGTTARVMLSGWRPTDRAATEGAPGEESAGGEGDAGTTGASVPGSSTGAPQAPSAPLVG